MVGTKPLFDQREKLLQVVRLLITPHRLDLAGDLERELPVPRHGVAHLANLKGNNKSLLASVGSIREEDTRLRPRWKLIARLSMYVTMIRIASHLVRIG